MSPVIADAPRRFPGSLVVQARPINDFHIDSASWSDIARLMRGQEISVDGLPVSVRFHEATTAQNAYQLAVGSSSLSRLAENGLAIEASSPRALVLNNIALPALRDTIAERLATQLPISENLMIVALLQFVPTDVRKEFLKGTAQRSSIEDAIAISQSVLAERTNPSDAFTRLLSASDDLVALTHHMKSHQMMVAHLSSLTEGAQVRKSAYVMNDLLQARKGTSAFERIANRGAVLETIGR